MIAGSETISVLSMNVAIFVLLLVVGLINFLPVIGVLSAQKLSSAYAVELVGNDIIILMRHRALLFGIIGSFVLYALFKPLYQTPAMLMAGVSMLGFLFFSWAAESYNASITKIMMVDVVGIICLLIATVLKYLQSSH